MLLSLLPLVVDAILYIVIMFGFYIFVRGVMVLNAMKKNHDDYVKEYGSKKYHPTVLVALGIALMTASLFAIIMPD